MPSAISALSRPAPVMAGMMGWNMLAMYSSTLLSLLCFFLGSSAEASTGFAISKLPRATTSWYTCGTSGPMTTWYWPPALITDRTPLVFFRASVSALSTSFRVKRRRVAQCSTLSTFSLPPTFSRMTAASCL